MKVDFKYHMRPEFPTLSVDSSRNRRCVEHPSHIVKRVFKYKATHLTMPLFSALHRLPTMGVPVLLLRHDPALLAALGYLLIER